MDSAAAQKRDSDAGQAIGQLLTIRAADERLIACAITPEPGLREYRVETLRIARKPVFWSV